MGKNLDAIMPGAGGVTTVSEGRMERVVIRKLTWRLLPFLFLLYIVAYLDRTNVGFAALQMQPRLHLNDAQYGFGSGICFFVGYCLFQVPSNLVLQRVGAKRWIAVLMMIWGVISSAMIFVTSVRSFYTVRFLLGAAEAGFYPGVILYLRNWFPLSARARTVAWFMTAAPLSGVVGNPVSGALLDLQGRWGMAGWQWMFLMEGLPAIVLGGVVLAYLTNRAEDAPWLTDEQRTWLLDRLGQEQTVSVAGGGSGKGAAFGIGAIWALAFVYFGLNTVSYGVSMWLPNLIHSLSGVSNTVIGRIAAIPNLAAVVVMMLVGFHSDRTGERRWHIAVPAFAGAAALGVAAYSHSIVLSIVAFSVAVLGVFSMVAPVWALATSRLSGAAAAVGIALINSVGNLGGGFGPYIIGFIRNVTGTFQGGLLVLGAVLGSAGVMALLVRPEARREMV